MRVARLHRRMRDVAAATGFAIMLVLAAIAILPAAWRRNRLRRGVVLVLATRDERVSRQALGRCVRGARRVLNLVRLLTIR